MELMQIDLGVLNIAYELSKSYFTVDSLHFMSLKSICGLTFLGHPVVERPDINSQLQSATVD